jgi:hypothetical protein
MRCAHRPGGSPKYATAWARMHAQSRQDAHNGCADTSHPNKQARGNTRAHNAQPTTQRNACLPACSSARVHRRTLRARLCVPRAHAHTRGSHSRTHLVLRHALRHRYPPRLQSESPTGPPQRCGSRVPCTHVVQSGRCVRSPGLPPAPVAALPALRRALRRCGRTERSGSGGRARGKGRTRPMHSRAQRGEQRWDESIGACADDGMCWPAG